MAKEFFDKEAAEAAAAAAFTIVTLVARLSPNPLAVTEAPLVRAMDAMADLLDAAGLDTQFSVEAGKAPLRRRPEVT